MKKIPFIQQSAKELDIFIDLLNVKGTLKTSSPVSFQNTSIKGNCEVGAYTYFGKNCSIRDTKIGNYCSIASDVDINPKQHPTTFLSTHSFAFGDIGGFTKVEKFARIKQNLEKPVRNKPIVIGHDVWIGKRAMIMEGVKIDNGAIVAAGSIVTKDVPPFAIVGGIPAKILKYRFSKELIQKIEDSNWFNYVLDKKQLGQMDYSNIISSLELINESQNKLEKILLNILMKRKEKIIEVE